MDLEEITTLSPASSQSRSLRTTFPISLAKLLKLKEGDKIKWELDAVANDLVVTIRPLRKNETEAHL